MTGVLTQNSWVQCQKTPWEPDRFFGGQKSPVPLAWYITNQAQLVDFTRIWDYIASKIRGYSKQYIAGWWLHWIIFQHGGHWVYVNYLLLVGKCGCVRSMLFFHQPSMCHFSWETDDEALDSGDSPIFRQTDDVPFWSPAVLPQGVRLRRGSQDAECLQNFQGPALADEQHHRLPVLWLSKTRYGSIYLGYPQIDVLQWTIMECSIKVDHLGVPPF